MRVIQTLFACCLSAVCLAGLGADAAETPHPLAVEIAFDRPINASSAPLVVAMTDGLFSTEGLAVTSSVATGSPEAIARVASGASEFAVVDINALIRFRDPQRALASGQVLAFYDGEHLLGGGIYV